MTLPFEFESRPIDQIMTGQRKLAHATSTCLACRQRVDYANLAELDQREYRISYICPACFDALADPED